MNKSRYIIVSPKWGAALGGIEAWAYLIKKNLESNHCDVDILDRSKINTCNFFSIVRYWFKTMKYDMAILMTWRMSFFLIFRLLLGKKNVIIVHGDELLNNNFFAKLIAAIIFRLSNVRVISNSRSTENILYSELGIKSHAIINPFIDFYAHANGIANIVPNKNKTMTFLTVTRMVKRKNIKNVLKALKLLDDNSVEFIYHLAGDGPELNEILELIEELGLQDRVYYHGRISENDKFELYNKADYFILPSIIDTAAGSIEGYGIVYIEANSHGVPVIAGNTGGANEAVLNGVTGITCDGSCGSIHRAILLAKDILFEKETLLEHAKKHHYLNICLPSFLRSLYEN
ncbi:TPA: glycosyltransferase [Vibrio vulnificus]|nr:glycosyltransferase [Vibrio vulnificus]